MRAKELAEHLTLRPHVTSDQYVCGQVVNEYKRLNLKGKRVFDLGGNIGAFTMYAHLMGASQIWAYEPDPENYALMEQNVGDIEGVTLIQGAVTGYRTDTVKFYLTKGKSRDGFSIVPFNGRTEITVPAYDLVHELSMFQPQVIKMDIEGGEYSMLPLLDRPFVEEIVVEIHFSKKKFRQAYDALIKPFEDWDVLVQPRQTGTNFHTLAHWRRKNENTAHDL